MPVLQITTTFQQATPQVEEAVKITGVSSTGVLSYNGGAIDPNVGEITKKRRPGIPENWGKMYSKLYRFSFNKWKG